MKNIYFLLLSNLFLSFLIHIHSAEQDLNLKQIITAVLTNQPELLLQLRDNGVCFAGARTLDGFPILVGNNFMSSTMTELLLNGRASPLDQCPESHSKITALQLVILQTVGFKKTEDQDQLRRIELLVKDLKTRAEPGKKALKEAKNYLNQMSGNGTEKSRIMKILSEKTNYSSTLPITKKPETENHTASPTPTPSIDEQNYRNGLEQETPQPTPPGTPEIIELNGPEEEKAEKRDKAEDLQFTPIKRQNAVIISNDSDDEDEFTKIDFKEIEQEVSAIIKKENSKSSSWWPWK